jgi:hypothetical protein
MENGFELTVENVKWQSKQHKRCGTSFMLNVMLISLVIFMLLPPLDLVWRILSRVLLVPVIAGISYEFIRLAGKAENKVVNVLSKPGLWMQGLTTREPDDRMIEVAIQSVDAVFDWRAFLESFAPKETVKEKGIKSGQKHTDKSGVKAVAKAQAGNTVKAENKPAGKPDNNSAVKSNHKNENKKEVKTANLNPAQNKSKVTAEAANKPAKKNNSEEEDDEILKALDKYLDLNGDTTSGKQVSE